MFVDELKKEISRLDELLVSHKHCVEVMENRLSEKYEIMTNSETIPDISKDELNEMYDDFHAYQDAYMEIRTYYEMIKEKYEAVTHLYEMFYNFDKN